MARPVRRWLTTGGTPSYAPFFVILGFCSGWHSPRSYLVSVWSAALAALVCGQDLAVFVIVYDLALMAPRRQQGPHWATSFQLAPAQSQTSIGCSAAFENVRQFSGPQGFRQAQFIRRFYSQRSPPGYDPLGPAASSGGGSMRWRHASAVSPPCPASAAAGGGRCA
jgi:hypothetical protein